MAAITPVTHVLTMCLTNAAERNAFKTTERLNTLEYYAELTDSDAKAITSKLENAQSSMYASYYPNI